MIGTHDNLVGKRIKIAAGERLEPWAVQIIDLDSGEEITNITRIEIDLAVGSRENKARLHLYLPEPHHQKTGHTERIDVHDIECVVMASVEHADA